MSNYRTLWINVLGSLQTELERKGFIWAATRPSANYNCYDAEAYAREVGYLVQILRPMLVQGFEQHQDNKNCAYSDEVLDDLLKYILKRHAILKFGEQSSYWTDLECAA